MRIMNVPTESINAFELINIEEYANRLKVGRTTIFKWKQEGALIPGRHFFKKGKIVRYIWARDLIMEIHEKTKNIPQTIKQDPIGSKTKSPNKQSTLNFEY